MSTVPSASQRERLDLAVTYYQKSVGLAESWLAGRGIDLALAGAYRLGVVAEPCSGHEAYVGRLSIPYLTRAGVATIRFRALEAEATPKYLSLPRDTGRIYNTAAFFDRSSRIVICEGEIDAITVHEYAGVPAVGLQGASAWRPVYRRAFAGYAEVIVAGDGDEAGRKFTDKIVADLDNARPVYLPDEHDTNSLFTDEGPAALVQALRL